MSYTFLDNATPEHEYDTSRRIYPILNPDGQPRVRVEFGRADGLPSDYFPNAACDVAAALIRHANDAEKMAAKRAEEEAKIIAAKRAEEEAKILATKPHPRAERPHPDTFPEFWVWCDDGGQFRYTYGHAPTRFTPGTSFTGEPNFAPTPGNVAVWIKLAAAAGRASAW